MTAKEVIKAFVEGPLSVKDFEKAIRSDSAIEALLTHEAELADYVVELDLYT